MHLIRCTLSPSDLQGCDLVLESIAEKRPAKQALINNSRRSWAIAESLLTNTSTIPIARLASGLASPLALAACISATRFACVRSSRSFQERRPAQTQSQQLPHTPCAFGRLPLVVADGPGFVVNRLLMAYLNAALELLVAGVAAQAKSTLPCSISVCRWGRCAQLDEIGLDTAHFKAASCFPKLRSIAPVERSCLSHSSKSKQLGMKSRAGIYCYPSGLQTQP